MSRQLNIVTKQITALSVYSVSNTSKFDRLVIDWLDKNVYPVRYESIQDFVGCTFFSVFFSHNY